MKVRKLITLLSLALILAAGLYAVIYAYVKLPVTYDGSRTDVRKLYENPEMYKDDYGEPDGVADIIVKKNLSDTMAANDVASIVFDFRGFDTLGESFILLTAIAGSYVILSRSKKKEEPQEKKEEECHETV